MKNNSSIEVKFITNDKKVLNIEKLADKDLYITRQYAVDQLDYSKIYKYADYKMEIANSKNGNISLAITPAEIVCKIPDELLERIYSLEVIFKSNNETIKYFPEEKACGYGVLVVRLYALRENETVEKLQKVSTWPYKGATLPIGMTQHEFDCLKEHFRVY